MSINKVILVGNVGKDPEIRTMGNNNEVASFSLATTDYWKDKATGERKDRTEWHRVVVYSAPLIGVIKQYVKKGSKLYVEGSLQTRKWVNNTGVERYATEVVLQGFNSTLQMLDSRNSGGGGGYGGGDSAPAGDFDDDMSPPDEFVGEKIDDDIPF